MMLVVPIFPVSPAQQELLWHSLGSEPFLSWTLRRFSAAAEAGAQVLVLTNEKDVADVAATLHFTTRLVSGKDSTSGLFLPNGSEAVIRNLANFPETCGKQEIIVADYQNPLLPWSAMEQALTEFRRSDANLLVSVAPMEDHPAQLAAYFKIVDADMICLFDGQWPLPEKPLSSRTTDWSGQMASRPCLFDWEQFDATEKALVWCKHFLGNDIVFRPVHTVENSKAGHSKLPVFYFRESPHTIRRLMKLGAFPNSGAKPITGISLHYPLQLLKSVLVKTEKGHALYVRRDWFAHATLARLWKIRANNCLEQKFTDVPLPPEADMKTLSVPGCGHEFLGPLHTFEATSDLGAMVMTLLQPCEHGEADLMEPFQVKEKLWHVEQSTGRRVNSISGAVINGRQSFPSVYTLQSALAIGSLDSLLARRKKKLAEGQVQGFPLTRLQALTVTSPLDILKCKAYQRTQKMPHTSMEQNVGPRFEAVFPQEATIRPMPASPRADTHPSLLRSQKGKYFERTNQLRRQLTDLTKKKEVNWFESEKDLIAVREQITSLQQALCDELLMLHQLRKYCHELESGHSFQDLGRLACLMAENFTDLLKLAAETAEQCQELLDWQLEEIGQTAFKAGQDFFESGDVESALMAWETALKKDPQNEFIHHALDSLLT